MSLDFDSYQSKEERAKEAEKIFRSALKGDVRAVEDFFSSIGFILAEFQTSVFFDDYDDDD